MVSHRPCPPPERLQARMDHGLIVVVAVVDGADSAATMREPVGGGRFPVAVAGSLREARRQTRSGH